MLQLATICSGGETVRSSFGNPDFCEGEWQVLWEELSDEQDLGSSEEADVLLVRGTQKKKCTISYLTCCLSFFSRLPSLSHSPHRTEKKQCSFQDLSFKTMFMNEPACIALLLYSEGLNTAWELSGRIRWGEKHQEMRKDSIAEKNVNHNTSWNHLPL